MVLEYLPNGNLYEFMRGKSLDEGTILKLFRQMISAIDFVHSRKVFHRDIKPENILLDPQCNSKLCDFGFSAIFGDGQNRQTLCGTKDYLAPEVIMSHNQNDKVDIWCMGVLLYELIHKRPPFIGKNIIVLLEDIKSAKIKYLPNINPEFKRIIEWCLKLDPNQRPSARALIETFPILRENYDFTREVAVTNAEQMNMDSPGSFFKKNSEQKSNVNINIGSVNINFFNQESPAVDNKTVNRDYFNVYTNMPSSQGSERVTQVVDKELKQPKLSIPEKITTNDSSRFKYSVQNVKSDYKSINNDNDDPRIVKKFSEHSTNQTNNPSNSQTFITYTHNNNTHRVVNSMMEQKTETNKYFIGLKTPYSSNNSEREIGKNQDKRELKFSDSANLNYSPTPKTSNFFDFNSNEAAIKGSKQENAQSHTHSHPKITSYSPAPSRREFHQYSNVTVSNFTNNNTLSKQNLNYKPEIIQKQIEVVQPKLSITMNEVNQLSPQQLSSFSNHMKNSFSQNEQIKNVQQQPRKVSNNDPVQKVGNNFNWNRGQNVRDPNVQLVNIYKKDMNEPIVTHTNIYKNINRGPSPKTDNFDSRKYEQSRQTIWKDQHGRQLNTDVNTINKFQTMQNITTASRLPNEMVVNRTITYSLQSVEKRQQSSSSVPRRIEKTLVEPPKVNKQSQPLPSKYIVTQNAQQGAPNRDRVVRSSSAQISEPRRIRYLNV